MPWLPEHKRQTRQRILTTAARLFSQQGFERISIDQVMQAAGLTRGAFYAHFASKSELYAEAVVCAALNSRANFNQAETGSSLAQLAEVYLSRTHSQSRDQGCPLAFLTTDVSHQDPQVRQSYTRVFRGFVQHLAGYTPSASEAELLQQAVLLIGGLALARALDDEPLVDSLLAACQQGVLA